MMGKAGMAEGTSMKCIKCGEELPENSSMTMHLSCAQAVLKSISKTTEEKETEKVYENQNR